MARNRLAAIGALLADDTRAEILLTLLDGRAHTGSELARHVGVAPSTASEHLSRLQDAGMVAVEAQGRHRYFRLTNGDVARLVEQVAGTTAVAAPPPPRAPAALLTARSCYDHLAGEVAVGIYATLVRRGHLDDDGERADVTDDGERFLTDLGVDVAAARVGSRPTARRCLDWTQRRPHLAGGVGAGLFATLLDRSWVARGAQPRAVRITPTGRRELTRHFELEVG